MTLKLAHIGTINTLEKLSVNGDLDFCLLPMCKYSEYKQYFVNQLKQGRFVIGDNLVAEGETIPTDELVKIALELNITELIIPDIIGNKQKTDEMRKDFLDKYYNDCFQSEIRLMSVVQGSSLDEYMQCFNELNNDDKIHTIGLPFRMKFFKFKDMHKDLLHAYNRLLFLNLIKDKVKKPIHCLGCNSIMELLAINKLGFVRSLDSKILARYSKNKEEIEYGHEKKPEVKLFITDKLDNSQIQYIKINLWKLDELLSEQETKQKSLNTN